MSSKNDPTNRAKTVGKTYKGQTIVPVLYDGKSIGHGKYMAGSIRTDGGTGLSNRVLQTITDENGIPIPIKAIQYDKVVEEVDAEPKKIKGAIE